MGSDISKCCGVDIIIEASSIDTETIPKNKEISSKSKLAISSAYLLSNILTEFFTNDKNKCECMQNADEYKNVVQSILSNVLIQGGACRDLALTKPINDLDIICNTRELNKIHLQHLQKYHSNIENQSINIGCILWNLYLNKFDDQCKIYDMNMLQHISDKNDEKQKEDFMKSNKYIRNVEYTLNAKYITNILMESDIFKDKMHVEYWEDDLFSCFCAIINDSITYNGFNLQGQDFDILDAFKRSMDSEILVETKLAAMRTKPSQKLIFATSNSDEYIPQAFLQSSLQSIKMNTRKNLFDYDIGLNTSDTIDIYIPIYKHSMNDHFTAIDLTINGVMLSLAAVKYVLDNNVYDKNKFDITTEIYDELRAKIECGVDNYDIEYDFQKKLLTSSGTLVIAQQPQAHFWRVIKFGIRYYNDEWRISEKIIKCHEKYYNQWIDINEYSKNEQQFELIISEQFEGGYAKNVDEYEIMLQLFDTLLFKNRLMTALNTYNSFKKK
eukprot:108944_1